MNLQNKSCFAEEPTAEKDPKKAYDPAHLAGMSFEMNVLSDFTGRNETQCRIDYPSPNPFGEKVQRFTYTSVVYDVLMKSGTGKYFDTVKRVTETKLK